MAADPKRARQEFAQWKSAVEDNFFTSDPHLQSLLKYHGRSDLFDELEAFGQLSARVLDPLARISNQDENLPRLNRYDGQGNRIEAVDFHPSYHELGRHLYAANPMSKYRNPGHEFDSLCIEYLYAMNGEAGHACPMACTAGLIKIIQQNPGQVPEAWLERLLDNQYDTHYHGAQFLTEVQGGSDVGANSLLARPQADGRHRLYGEKWFCSVIDAHLYLVTARIEGEDTGTRGLRAFVVPRKLDDGRANDLHIRRLKYKLGTRSMASAELDFQGAWAYEVADFKDTVGVVLTTSRLYNAICSCGLLQRAWLEAHHYAQNRTAFSRPIAQYPMVARVVARLRAETYAARGLTFLLMNLGDRISLGKATAQEKGAYRMLVGLNKYWTSSVATRSILDAIEVFGGNGAIESFSVLPRLLRDSIVCEAWEGGHNILCLQALKDTLKLAIHDDMFDLLEDLSGPSERMNSARQRWEHLLEMEEIEALTHIRDMCDYLRPLAQGAALAAQIRAGDKDPILAAALDHLMTTTARGYDPMADLGLSKRVRTLIS